MTLPLHSEFLFITVHVFSLLFLCVSHTLLIMRSSWISTETVTVVLSAFNLSIPRETSFKYFFDLVGLL